jgi:hypothetical protein
MNDHGFETAVKSYESQCNDEPAKPAAHCAKCGRPLYEGDVIYKVIGEIFCENCCERTWL